AVAGESSGRPGAVAGDECDGEVGLVQSSEEASEQSSISCCGACGTKGRRRMPALGCGSLPLLTMALQLVYESWRPPRASSRLDHRNRIGRSLMFGYAEPRVF